MNTEQKQTVFDRVARHLLTQKARSYLGEEDGPKGFDGCAYRGRDGLKCAVGCLIDDEFYSRDLEGKSPLNETVALALRQSGVPLYITNNSDVGLLDDLQCLHDSAAISSWAKELRETAERHGLSHAVVDELEGPPA